MSTRCEDDGLDMPQIGFGTATLKEGDECSKSVSAALNAGVRLIDTALLYHNQVSIGKVLSQTSIPRKDIWITSKVGFFPSDNDVNIDPWMKDDANRKGDEAASIELCLNQLGVEYIDLILLHSPCTTRLEYDAARTPHYFELFTYAESEEAVRPTHLADGEAIRPMLLESKRTKLKAAIDDNYIEKAKATRIASWKGLEAAQRSGKCRYIGVSNYPAALLEEMKDYATILPYMNQLELHPLFSSPELQRVAKEMGCKLTGYGSGNSMLINHEYKHQSSLVVNDIAKRIGKSPMQIVLRWTLQNGIAIVPRSTCKDHIKENSPASLLS